MKKDFKYCGVLLVLTFVVFANGSPMFYKKNDNDKYEPDLIAVSSTVIPLTVYEASAGLGTDGERIGTASLMPSLREEYKLAYNKHLHKKVKSNPSSSSSSLTQSPGKLITVKNNGSIATVRSA